MNWGMSLFDVDTPCIFNTPANHESYEKSLKPVSENGLNGVLSDRNKKIKMITGVHHSMIFYLWMTTLMIVTLRMIPLRIFLL